MRRNPQQALSLPAAERPGVWLGGRHATIGLVALVLAGCGIFVSTVQPPCPSVVVLGDAQKVTIFRPGPGRDLTDVRFEGGIAALTPTCEYDDDGFVDTDVAIDMSFQRGPAAEVNVGHYEYFIAITDGSDEIIAKRVFPIDVEFPEGARRVTVTEQVSQRIYFAPGDDGSRHRIFVGFQLTREQLEFGRDDSG